MDKKYYITDTQIGLLKDLNKDLAEQIARVSGIIARHTKEIEELLEKIEKKQFIGEMKHG